MSTKDGEAAVVDPARTGPVAAMNTWIALLRGINVGGHRKLPMSTLREILTDIGCSDVRTYIQSGNAAFRSPSDPGLELAARIEATLGFRPEVLTRTYPDFRAAVEANPFPEATEDPKSLHLFFLDAAPPSEAEARLAEAASPPERFRLEGRVLYLHTSKYLSGSAIAPAAERLLGVSATARNWRSVTKILALAEAVATAG